MLTTMKSITLDCRLMLPSILMVSARHLRQEYGVRMERACSSLSLLPRPVKHLSSGEVVWLEAVDHPPISGVAMPDV